MSSHISYHEVVLKEQEPLHPILGKMSRSEKVAFMKSKLEYFNQRPYVSEFQDISEFVLEFLAREDQTDYSWSLSFKPEFFRRLIYDCFLPISTTIGYGLYVLLPWIDPKRCVLDWHEIQISKKVRKRAKHYSIRVNTDFQNTIKGCVGQHGESWLYPPMRTLLTTLNSDEANRCTHSIELYDNTTGDLVAGDLGYTVGAVYTSMTGFRNPDSRGVGTIQLIATAKLLQKLGFAFWDLGMVMDYKLANLHAHVEDRLTFRDRLIRHRDRTDVTLHTDEVTNAQALMKWNPPTSQADV